MAVRIRPGAGKAAGPPALGVEVRELPGDLPQPAQPAARRGDPRGGGVDQAAVAPDEVEHDEP